MEFTYLKNKFHSKEMTIYVDEGVHVEVGANEIVFKDWDEVRDFSAKLDDILREAILYKKRATYGKDLVVFPDEGEWTVWWKKQSIDVSATLLRSIPGVMRYFLKMYYKLMMDYKAMTLKEGFSVDITNKRYAPLADKGL